MFALKPTVSIVEEHDGVLLIDSASQVPAIRLSTENLPLLRSISSAQPDDNEYQSLIALLTKYGMLANTQANNGVHTSLPSGAIRLPNPDRLVKGGAALLRLLPDWLVSTMVAVVLMAAAVTTVMQLARLELTPAPAAPAWLLAYYLLTMLCHELTHAMTMRYHGLPVGAMGVKFGMVGIPSPFVSTKCIPTLRSQQAKASIPAAGPSWDLFMCGVLSGLLLWAPTETLVVSREMLTYMLFIQLGLLVMNLTPFRPSDAVLTLRYLMSSSNGRVNPRFYRLINGYKWVYASLVLLIFPVLVFVSVMH